MHVLFICGRNRKRSPTAEALFGGDSAGVAKDADVVVDADHIAAADLIVVMEGRHRRTLNQRFGALLKGKRVVCVDIPDDYEFMDDALVALLRQRVTPLLRSAGVDADDV